MRKRVAIIAAATIALVGGSLAVHPAASQVGGTVTKETLTKEKTERDTYLDLGKEGESVGDRLVIRGPLFDAATPSTRVGSFKGDFEFLSRDGVLMPGFVGEFLEGTITAAGSFSFRQLKAGQNVAITGGTGDYAQASGTISIEEISEGTVKLTFNISTA